MLAYILQKLKGSFLCKNDNKSYILLNIRFQLTIVIYEQSKVNQKQLVILNLSIIYSNLFSSSSLQIYAIMYLQSSIEVVSFLYEIKAYSICVQLKTCRHFIMLCLSNSLQYLLSLFLSISIMLNLSFSKNLLFCDSSFASFGFTF